MTNSEDLIGEMRESLIDLNILIDDIRKRAKVLGIPASLLRDAAGRFVLAPLLDTKAALLIPLYEYEKEKEGRDRMDAALELVFSRFERSFESSNQNEEH